MRLLEGRVFDRNDRAGTAPVVVVNTKPAIYAPVAQQSLWQASELIVRAQGDQLSLAPAVLRIVSNVDPEQPVAAVRTMEDILGLAIADRRQQMALLGTFAGLALLLASLGIYGVLSYLVTQRSREIGLRMALGASAQSVIRMVMFRGMLLTATGLAIGLGTSLALTRLMKTLLYGVAATDSATLAGVSVLVAAIALFACWLPARRASIRSWSCARSSRSRSISTESGNRTHKPHTSRFLLVGHRRMVTNRFIYGCSTVITTFPFLCPLSTCLKACAICSNG